MSYSDGSRFQQAADGGRARPPACCHRRGFTLIELLTVMAIITLVVAASIPVFKNIAGGRGVDGAANQISAAMSAGRAEAMQLGRVGGVMFYIDPTDGRCRMALVYGDRTPAGNPQVLLDTYADYDFYALPTGVGAQTILNATVVNGQRTIDGYLGYNRIVAGNLRTILIGGVILFDGHGQLLNITYGFRTGVSGNPTPMGKLLFPKLANGFPNTMVQTSTCLSNSLPLSSQAGVVLFDLSDFQDRFFTLRDSIPSQYTTPSGAPDGQAWAGEFVDSGRMAEKDEEQWLDDNATLLLVNRYNGTVIKGE